MENIIYSGNNRLPGIEQVNSTGKGNRINNSAENSVFTDMLASRKNHCPYEYLSQNGVIQYNGVTFACDTEHNLLTLGDVKTDRSKVINVALPSGGNLEFNVDNINDITKAASMFSPEDLNAIMKAIITYKHCQEKLQEKEKQENSTPEENAVVSYQMEDDSFDSGSVKDDKNNLSLTEQFFALRNELYYKIMNGKTEQTFAIGAQEFSIKEWNKFIERFDESEENVKQMVEEEIEKRMERNEDRQNINKMRGWFIL